MANRTLVQQLPRPTYRGIAAARARRKREQAVRLEQLRMRQVQRAPQYVPYQQTKEYQQDISKINKQIAAAKKQYDYIAGLASKFGGHERGVEKSLIKIRELEQAKKEIKAGYTYRSSVQRAFDVISKEAARMERAAEPVRERAYRFALDDGETVVFDPRVASYLKKEGLKPLPVERMPSAPVQLVQREAPGIFIGAPPREVTAPGLMPLMQERKPAFYKAVEKGFEIGRKRPSEQVLVTSRLLQEPLPSERPRRFYEAIEKPSQLFPTPSISGIFPQLEYKAPTERVRKAREEAGEFWTGVRGTLWEKPKGFVLEKEEVFKERVTRPLLGGFVTKEAQEKYKKGIEAFQKVFWAGPAIWKPSEKVLEERQELGAGFITGAVTGVKEKPLKAGVTFGLALAAGPVFGVGGKFVPAALKVSAGGKIFGFGVKYAVPTLYGASVVQRVRAEKTPFKKGEMAGEIFSTEIAPMFAGYKAGRYVSRRLEAKVDLWKYTRQLPPEQRKLFKTELKEARALFREQPKVRELSFKRLAQLEKTPKAQKELLKYFQLKKDVIIGGSIAQETQLYGVGTKRPSDIDVYLKSAFADYQKVSYGKEVSKMLRGYGLEARAYRGKVWVSGKKTIEFLPYSQLQYNIEQVIPAFATARGGITKTPSGIKVMRLSVQYPRKLIGGFLEPYITGKVRVKDIPAAMAIKKSLLETRGIRLKTQAPQLMSFGVMEKTLTAQDVLGTTGLKSLTGLSLKGGGFRL